MPQDLEDVLSKSRSDIAAALNTLNGAGVSYEQQFGLLQEMDLSRPAATVWTDLYYAALNVFNARLKALVLAEDYTHAKELAGKIPTPEGRLIARVLDDQVETQAMQRLFNSK